MGKSKATYKNPLPIAPWIYINDPTQDSFYATRLASHIPSIVHVGLTETLEERAQCISVLKDDKYHDTVALIADNKDDDQNDTKQRSVKSLREAAIKYGCNFVSVNIYLVHAGSKTSNWGTNHLDICVEERAAQDIAETIYKWLFTVLTVQETLHLIPEEQMKEIDKVAFPQYAYCPINQSRYRPKDARIQFVALVLSKPEIGPGQKLTWTVADRTGVANFYFQYRGAQSQYTWDWVLALKPGDRKALPRMPMIEVKEKKRVTVIKAPFRASGAIIGGTGFVIKSVGKGLCNMGKVVRLGKRSEWIPEEDYKRNSGKSSDMKIVPSGRKTEIKVFNEKGEKTWSDRDSVASTTAGSVMDEKIGKEFI